MNEDNSIVATEYPSDSLAISATSTEGVESSDLPRGLKIQRLVGYLLMLPFCTFLVILMRYWRGYQIENLSQIRRQFREITKNPDPILICANHLTFIDSCIMLWGMASNPWYLFHYRCFSWNLPAGDFFKKKFRYRAVAYLAKCIFIHRDGTREHKNEIVDLCRKLLMQGEIVSVFPEGRRSRSGRFGTEELTKGAGRLVASVPKCRVLCVYVRSDKQETFSNYPAKDSRFYFKMQELRPTLTRPGREGYAEITEQIAERIKAMEAEYFAKRATLA